MIDEEELYQQESLLPIEDSGQKVVKKRGWHGYKNLPSYDGLAGTGDNTRYLQFIMDARKMPKINTGDVEQVRQRRDWYFNYCMENDMRPTVSGLAAAFGVTRVSLWHWRAGINRPQNYQIIDEAYNMLEELWELYMMDGKINPPNGIFLGKNHFGYKDVQDVIVTPNNPLGEGRSADEIAEQYAFLPEE